MGAFAAFAGFLLLAVIALSVTVIVAGMMVLFVRHVHRVLRSNGEMGFWDF